MSQRIDIASIRADHIIELGSGASKKTRRLMDAHFRVAPEERVLTEISRKFTPDQLHQLLDRGGFALQSNNQTPNKYFELVLACFRKINADIAIKIHPRPRAISAFWLVKNYGHR